MKEAKQVSPKKALQKETATQLQNNLGTLKTLLGEKKFEARVKKAAKLLTEGLGKESRKAKEAPVKKIVQKEKKSPAKPVAPAKKKAAPKVAAAKKAAAKVAAPAAPADSE